MAFGRASLKLRLWRFVLTIVSAIPMQATAQGIKAGPNLDEYCKSPVSSRDTLIYFDPVSLELLKGLVQRDVRETLGLSIRERLQIILVDPTTSTGKPIFNECVPGLTKEELDTEKKEKTWRPWEQSPESSVEIANDVFKQRLNEAMKKLEGLTNAQRGTVDLAQVLHNDKTRLQSAGRSVRIILVSEMRLANLPSTDGIDPGSWGRRLSKQYPIDVTDSAVAVLGKAHVPNGYTPVQVEQVWRTYFLEAGAPISSYGGSIPQSQPLPKDAITVFKGTWRQSEQSPMRDAEMRFVVLDGSGTGRGATRLFDGKGGFTRFYFTGRLECKDTVDCKLNGEVTYDAPYLATERPIRERDKLNLSGARGVLDGVLEAPAGVSRPSGGRSTPMRFERVKN
jgi:hypothetical protein